LSVFDDHEAAANPPLRFPRLHLLCANDRLVDAKSGRRGHLGDKRPGSDAVRAQLMTAKGWLLANLGRWLTPSVTAASVDVADEAAFALFLSSLFPHHHLARVGLYSGSQPLAGGLVRYITGAPVTPNFWTNLRRFSAGVAPAAVAPLAAALHAAPLACLSLSVYGQNVHGVLSAAARLTTLRTLWLSFRSATFSRHEVLSLRAVTALRTLAIDYIDEETNDFPLAAPDLTAADLVQLLRCLPRLRHLTLCVSAVWSRSDPRSLRDVSGAAPQLESLHLVGRFQLQALDSAAAQPAFPQLKRLEFTYLELVLPPVMTALDRRDVLGLR
jgi:hypothetical protein